MKYMGSKARIAKEILPIILKDRKPGQWYVEPFCGGCNTIDKVDGNRIANDKNTLLIAMFSGLVEGRTYPTDIPKNTYDLARNEYNIGTRVEFDDFLMGWVGWMGSANGRFFDGGYSGKSNTKIGTVRDYIKEAIGNIEKQLPALSGIEFCSCDYKDLLIPSESIIYCDIPYKDTKQYATSKGFSHELFWEWAKVKTNEGHSVFVSEYQAPAEWSCVWEKKVKSSLSANGICGASKESTEKLFTFARHKASDKGVEK